MRSKHFDMVKQGVHILNTLGIKNKDIMLCGSITFDLFGVYPDDRGNAHDVDFVVRTDEKTKEKVLEIFKLYERMVGKPTDCQTDYPTYALTVKDLTLNVWFIGDAEHFETDLKMNIPCDFGFNDTSIWVAKLSDTLAKKNEYNRGKDNADKVGICKLILG